jgi:hypothetical protein
MSKHVITGLLRQNSKIHMIPLFRLGHTKIRFSLSFKVAETDTFIFLGFLFESNLTYFLGKRTQENGKECLIIVNHDTGEITLERINTRAVVRIQRGADSEVYDFKPTTFTPRTVLPVKREHRPEPIIMPTVAPPTQNAQPIRPQKQPRSAPIVKKKPKREEEIPVDFELPSIIKHQMEPIDTNVPILGLGGFKPSPKSHHPAAQSQPPAQPPAPEPTSGLFSTSGRIFEILECAIVFEILYLWKVFLTCTKVKIVLNLIGLVCIAEQFIKFSNNNPLSTNIISSGFEDIYTKYCRMRLRGQNDKNLAIFEKYVRLREQNGALKL